MLWNAAAFFAVKFAADMKDKRWLQFFMMCIILLKRPADRVCHCCIPQYLLAQELWLAQK